MSEIWLICGMALVTFAIRYTLFAVSGQLEFSKPLARALQYVPPAVLTAIIVPAVLIPTGDNIQFNLQNAYLVGGVVAFIVGWFSKNLLLTIISGMAVFLLWQWALTII